MIRVSNFSKMGDVMYSLPVVRALARVTGEKVTLLLSGSAYQLAPLLWEQPFIQDVELEDTQAHATVPIDRGAVFPEWEWYKGNGFNLSLQPSYFTDDAPLSWTLCCMRAAGLSELQPADYVVLPSLINHRRWMDGIDVELNGKRQAKPKTIILAPETDTLDELMPKVWQDLINLVNEYGHTPILVGVRPLVHYMGCIDLRGQTSVPVLARLIAESRGFIGAHSFPWHLARHTETPAVCLQTWREGLRRCLPIDTPYTWLTPDEWHRAVPIVINKEEALCGQMSS